MNGLLKEEQGPKAHSLSWSFERTRSERGTFCLAAACSPLAASKMGHQAGGGETLWLADELEGLAAGTCATTATLYSNWPISEVVRYQEINILHHLGHVQGRQCFTFFI